jgi:hypothetical protein
LGYNYFVKEKELIAKAMAALGRRTSEAKRKASRENGKKGGEAVMKPLDQFPCKCGIPLDHNPEHHLKSCLLGRALRRRQS